MAEIKRIKLTKQKNQGKSKLKADVADFHAILNERKEIWAKLSNEKKQDWLDRKIDPVLSDAYENYLIYHEFFGGLNG